MICAAMRPSFACHFKTPMKKDTCTPLNYFQPIRSRAMNSSWVVFEIAFWKEFLQTMSNWQLFCNVHFLIFESIAVLTKYLNYQLEEESDRKPFKLCASVGKLITSWQPATSGNFYGLKTMQIAESGSFYGLGTLIIAEYGTTEPFTNIAISWEFKLLSFYCKLKSHRIKKIISCHSFFWLEGIANCRK